jgi:hypothetical protein
MFLKIKKVKTGLISALKRAEKKNLFKEMKESKF